MGDVVVAHPSIPAWYGAVADLGSKPGTLVSDEIVTGCSESDVPLKNARIRYDERETAG